jgi:hypothetical protein
MSRNKLKVKVKNKKSIEMGNSQSTQNIKINFQDMQYVIKNPDQFILINTLGDEEQRCLIINTISIKKEIELFNTLIKNNNKSVNIILYGKNCNDEKLLIKYNQLITLGFYQVKIYMGGMFEWLMLQEIYGEKEFPTTTGELDILKYKPPKLLLGYHLLEN